MHSTYLTQCLHSNTECVLFTYGWLAPLSRFTHVMCGLPRMVRITESVGKTLDHFRSESDQTNRVSTQPKAHCTSFYVSQDFSGAPIRTAARPLICLFARNGL